MSDRLSYVHRPPTTPYDSRIFPDYLDEKVSVSPGREAMVFYSESGQRNCLSYQDLYTRSLQIAAGLLESGLTKEDRAVIVAPNCIEYLEILVACSRIGVCLLLLKFGSTADELLLAARKYGAKAIFVHSGADSHFVQSVLLKCKVANHENAPVTVFAIDFSVGDYQCGVSYSNLLNRKLSQDEISQIFDAQRKVQMEDPFIALLTSGSTGKPKACLFNHFQFLRISENNASAACLSDGARLFNDRPFSWKVGVAAGLNLVLTKGVTLVSQQSAVSVRCGDLETSFRIMRSEECTHALIMPYMLYDISVAEPRPEMELPSLKYGLTTGQVTQTDVITTCLGKYPGLKILNVYGATEIDGWPTEPFSIDNMDDEDLGWFNIEAGVEAKVVDDKGRTVPRGQRGELYIRGPALFEGYLDDSELTAKYLTPLRWFKTGDLAVMDRRSRIQIHGRISFAIKRATVYVNPADVENILSQHPLILQVAVVGVPDTRLHEELCACVILNNEAKPDKIACPEAALKEIREWSDTQFVPGPDGLTLSPRYFLLFSSFPLSHSGKTQILELRALAKKKKVPTATPR